MIIYDLLCVEQQHRFEGWFKNSDDFSRQIDQGLLSCPICSSHQVKRIPSVSKISHRTSTQHPSDSRAATPDLIHKLHDYVERHFDDVGDQFSQQAIDMHLGEREPRNIRGTANLEQIKQLHETGVKLLALPPNKTKLN